MLGATFIVFTLLLRTCYAQTTMLDARALGTHNSYHLRPQRSLIEWDYNHPSLANQASQYGVRYFELDIHGRTADDMDHRVFHRRTYDELTNCADLTQCLGELESYSVSVNRQNPILFVQMDFAVIPDFVFFDNLLRTILGMRLYSPSDMQGASSSLLDQVNAAGWPTIASTIGRVMIFASMDQTQYASYVNATGGNQVMFRMCPPAELGLPTSPECVIGNGQHPRDQAAIDVLSDLAQRFLIRVRADTPESYFKFDVMKTATEQINRAYFDVIDVAPADNMVSLVELVALITVLDQAPSSAAQLGLGAALAACSPGSAPTQNPAISFQEFSACLAPFAASIGLAFPSTMEAFRTDVEQILHRDLVLASSAQLIQTDRILFDNRTCYVVALDHCGIQCAPGHASCVEADLAQYYSSQCVDRLALASNSNCLRDAENPIDIDSAAGLRSTFVTLFGFVLAIMLL